MLNPESGGRGKWTPEITDQPAWTSDQFEVQQEAVKLWGDRGKHLRSTSGLCKDTQRHTKTHTYTHTHTNKCKQKHGKISVYKDH